MKGKDIGKQLLPGLVVGFILGFVLIYFVGVDEENEIPNIIGGVMSCVVPTLLNGIIVLKGTAGVLKRKLSIGNAFLRNLPYIVIAAIIGFLFARVYLVVILGINLCTIDRMLNTLMYASLGAIVSTILAFIALKQYEKSVKYTRRTEEEK